ncbi:hypothetical protein Z043_121843, partial [Scleropages formosus]
AIGMVKMLPLLRLDGTVDSANEILEPAPLDRPLIAQGYSAVVIKGYSEDQGAAGGIGVEEDMSCLRLDEENEQPPMTLETD